MMQKPELTPEEKKHRRNKALIIAGFTILILALAAETAVIVQQNAVNRQIEAQSEKALGRFLKSGQAKGGNGGTAVLLRNVQFCWSRQICITTDKMTGRIVPLSGGSTVNFDNIRSFMVDVRNAGVEISPKTLEGMFNESVFNYPGSNLRNLTVGIVQRGDRNMVQLNGSLRYILWIPFQMDTTLSVDKNTNTLNINVEKLRVFGFIPAKWLIDLRPFNLSKLLTVPENKHLTVSKNTILVKPFGLFPPPRVNGKIANIQVGASLIKLTFAGTEPGLPRPAEAARNYMQVFGGTAQFGNLQMNGTDIEIVDNQPNDLFRFSLLGYLSYLPRSEIKTLSDGSVLVSMPDHQIVPEGSKQIIGKDEKTSINTKVDDKGKTISGKKPSLWERTKNKFRSWFHKDKPKPKPKNI